MICENHYFQKNPCLLGTQGLNLIVPSFSCGIVIHILLGWLSSNIVFMKSLFQKRITTIWCYGLNLIVPSFSCGIVIHTILFFILLGWLTSMLSTKSINFPLSDSGSLLWQWSTRVIPGTLVLPAIFAFRIRALSFWENNSSRNRDRELSIC